MPPSRAARALAVGVAARVVERTDERRVRLCALVDEKLVAVGIQDKRAADNSEDPCHTSQEREQTSVEGDAPRRI